MYDVQYCGPGDKASVEDNMRWWATMLKVRAEATTQLGRKFCNTSSGNLYAENLWASKQYVCPQSWIAGLQKLGAESFSAPGKD